MRGWKTEFFPAQPNKRPQYYKNKRGEGSYSPPHPVHQLGALTSLILSSFVSSHVFKRLNGFQFCSSSLMQILAGIPNIGGRLPHRGAFWKP